MLLNNAILIRLDDELFARVEDWRARHRPATAIPPRTKAVRDLIARGLDIDQEEIPAK